MTVLHVEKVSHRYNRTEILRGIDLVLPEGKVTGLIGPNGSGKTTLIKLLSKTIPLQEGRIKIGDTPLANLTSKQLSQQLSVVSQESDIVFDFKVEELVMMGRYPYKKLFDTETAEDSQIVEKVLKNLGLLNLKHRSFKSLSGGERQRVLIARTLAQQTDLVIFDEPTNHLDIYHQIQLFESSKQLGVTVCAGVHDLNFALTYCDYLLVMKAGEIVARGEPAVILTPDLIEQVYQVKTDILYHAGSQKKVIVYL